MLTSEKQKPAAFVSRMHSITNFPVEFRTATEMVA
jgi:hypothetical protein